MGRRFQRLAPRPIWFIDSPITSAAAIRTGIATFTYIFRHEGSAQYSLHLTI